MTGSGSIADPRCLSFCSKLTNVFPKLKDVGAAVWLSDNQASFQYINP